MASIRPTAPFTSRNTVAALDARQLNDEYTGTMVRCRIPRDSRQSIRDIRLFAIQGALVRTRLLAVSLLLAAAPLPAQRADAIQSEIDRGAAAIADKVTAWRHDIHSHPELSFQETRTAKLVADHLRSLGLEVQTGVGGNGVVGILRGGKPGGVVALRADMDALPVVEQINVPYKSTVRTTYNGQDVGVMHACGHDMHTAILMGTAEVLAGVGGFNEDLRVVPGGFQHTLDSEDLVPDRVAISQRGEHLVNPDHGCLRDGPVGSFATTSRAGGRSCRRRSNQPGSGSSVRAGDAFVSRSNISRYFRSTTGQS